MKRLNTFGLSHWELNLYHIGEQNPEEKYITWGLIRDPFKGYPEQFIELKIVHNMDIDTNSNGNSNQVGNQVGDLTVLIGSDPFLPQPESPTVEPEFDTVDENLNTPPLPSPSNTQEYQLEDFIKLLHPYLEAGVCLDTESKRILETPTSPLNKSPTLTELKPADPEIFASPPLRKRKRRNNPPATSNPPEKPSKNILYHRPPTPIPTFVQPPPQGNDFPVRPLLLVQPVHIPAGKGAKSPPSLLQLIVSPTPDLLHKLKTSRIPYVTSAKRSYEQTLL